uniref:Uncharacterized protein n=1 Tax=Podoviridae sp. ct8dV2 TaxID=2825222 RepID=A0A8S5PQV3_9CAUD|nr:MAG TPA: hypothetical protein [Podoviridae sp. ct8dV2]
MFVEFIQFCGGRGQLVWSGCDGDIASLGHCGGEEIFMGWEIALPLSVFREVFCDEIAGVTEFQAFGACGFGLSADFVEDGGVFHMGFEIAVAAFLFLPFPDQVLHFRRGERFCHCIGADDILGMGCRGACALKAFGVGFAAFGHEFEDAGIVEIFGILVILLRFGVREGVFFSFRGDSGEDGVHWRSGGSGLGSCGQSYFSVGFRHAEVAEGVFVSHSAAFVDEVFDLEFRGLLETCEDIIRFRVGGFEDILAVFVTDGVSVLVELDAICDEGGDFFAPAVCVVSVGHVLEGDTGGVGVEVFGGEVVNSAEHAGEFDEFGGFLDDVFAEFVLCDGAFDFVAETLRFEDLLECEIVFIVEDGVAPFFCFGVGFFPFGGLGFFRFVCGFFLCGFGFGLPDEFALMFLNEEALHIVGEASGGSAGNVLERHDSPQR